jgi:broad specificity phosphatase PhoE
VDTIVCFVRHAAHAMADGVLVGRKPGVALNSTGLQQAHLLAERFERERISCVQSSPRLRARQTAQSIATKLELPVEIVPDVDELDTGAWTGLPFDELAKDPRWHRWNAARGSARVPDGETMRELQDRVLGHLAYVRTGHPNGRVVIVSHAEPIRAVLLHYKGIPLDDFARVRVGLATVTTLLICEQSGEVISENEDIARLVPA